MLTANERTNVDLAIANISGEVLMQRTNWNVNWIN